MKFEFIQNNDDGAGYVRVTAERPGEVRNLADRFRMIDYDDTDDLLRLADAIRAGSLVYESPREAKRPYYLPTTDLTPAGELGRGDSPPPNW